MKAASSFLIAAMFCSPSTRRFSSLARRSSRVTGGFARCSNSSMQTNALRPDWFRSTGIAKNTRDSGNQMRPPLMGLDGTVRQHQLSRFTLEDLGLDVFEQEFGCFVGVSNLARPVEIFPGD